METIGEVKDNMAIDLGSLLDAGDGAVVTLVAGDTHLVAHKAVLAARSPIFAAMFRHNTLEANRGEVAIPDVEGRVLRQLLAYLYTLQAPQLSAMAPQLLVAADKYGVSVLKAECEKQVSAQLSVETAVTTAVLAIRHSCTILRQAAIAYIKTHVFEVMATQGWADAFRMHHEDMVELSRLLSETSVPVTADSRTSPATQQHSDKGDCSHNPASAALPSAASHHTVPPDDAAVSRLRSLSPEEKDWRLIQAVRQGAVGELEALLAAGADARARDECENTALHWAASEGRVEVVRRLLAAGAAVNTGNKRQQTPLHDAAFCGRTDVVRLLLAARADHSARDETGSTPLHWAAFHGHTQAAAALLEAGADRGARDNWGRTPLDHARGRKYQQLAELLQGR